MKNPPSHTPVLATIAGLLILPFGATPALAAEVSLQYEEPEKFSDLGDNRRFDESTFARFKDAMDDAFGDVADRYLDDGASLEVTFLDVDLAGETEPWMAPPMHELRVVRDIYPPRLKFHFIVRDASGEKMKEGTAQLSDNAFLWNIGTPTTSAFSRTFVYESDLIDTWARRNLRALKTAKAS